jgi:hypothetical protein
VREAAIALIAIFVAGVIAVIMLRAMFSGA